MKIACLEDRDSAYALMDAFLDAFTRAAEELGHGVTRHDVRQVAMHPARVSGADICFSFAGVGLGAEIEPPLCTWLVDNPVHTRNMHRWTASRDGAFVVDETHTEVLRRFLGAPIAVGFMPHGTTLTGAGALPGAAERTVDVLVAGSYVPRRRPQTTTDEPAVAASLETLAKFADDRWDAPVRDLQVWDLFLEAIAMHGVHADVDAHRTVAPLLAWLDEDMRLRRRAACVRALDRAGVQLHVAGAGWERLELEHAVLLGPIDHHALLDLVRSARVLLNVGPPLFNRGWHERVPMGLAAGAHVVTEANDWMAQDTALSGLVTTFEMCDHAALPDVVRAALAEGDRSDAARAGYELVRDHHTWAHRTRDILAAIEL